MFNEYDIVYSSVDINEEVKPGTKGVILMVLDLKKEVYEVEFVNSNDGTIDVTEVRGAQLRK
ncbi:DUF4926 domain-containing protein [Listeria monocytogenes]|uniref:DUF4926 domain-containing protein n=1 Tax=Listeria monocytogenes TaxID=1639 RepID=UPI0008755812|nr:DUF4926 domain-containing protein [Listeria monocytogenes]EAF4457223.1 DUF4926 domain-containing protein [Listeria monocytogenes serotype 1/2a]EAA0348809.1 DUF4926 domain-containing protein [Listeria monocytogenes]EAD7000521.1 DUF4926 domain-containing protein [Listeria monocytogenes]EAE9231525.1 DUF4926 domain-containing protein [Listeria monocytogenes]EAG9257517.1 DUF4926 domain-containing protein [Listeria monocytogenes]